MKNNNKTVLFGLGVDDPKGIFGTTKGLQEIFGKQRVFDMPASENAMTGVAIGMSLNKMIPIIKSITFNNTIFFEKATKSFDIMAIP